MESYLDFAENDFQFFQQCYDAGFVANAMAVLAQEICEKYLKHIIVVLAKPKNQLEEAIKEIALKTHSLIKLIRFLKIDLKITIPEDVEVSLRLINNYRSSMVCPGNDAFFADAEYIERAEVAVRSTRQFIYNTLIKAGKNVTANTKI